MDKSLEDLFESRQQNKLKCEAFSLEIDEKVIFYGKKEYLFDVSQKLDIDLGTARNYYNNKIYSPSNRYALNKYVCQVQKWAGGTSRRKNLLTLRTHALRLSTFLEVLDYTKEDEVICYLNENFPGFKILEKF